MFFIILKNCYNYKNFPLSIVFFSFFLQQLTFVGFFSNAGLVLHVFDISKGQWFTLKQPHLHGA